MSRERRSEPDTLAETLRWRLILQVAVAAKQAEQGLRQPWPTFPAEKEAR